MTTLVRGPIKLVTDRPDTVRKINLRAPELRLHGAGIVTDHSDDIPVVDGQVEFEALPGPAVLTLVTAGDAPLRSVDIVVPDEDTATLSECLDQIYVYDPPVVGRAQQFAREAGEHAARAEAGADRVGSAEQVGQWVGEAEVLHDDTVAAAEHAETQAGIATEQAGVAAGHAEQAGEDRAQTGADRRQTGEDRAQTGEDREAAEGWASQSKDAATLAITAAAVGVEGYSWEKGPITSGTDLNDVTAPGVYEIRSYTVANSLKNRPTAPSTVDRSALEVLATGGGAVHQTWIPIRAAGLDAPLMHRRRDNGGTWTEWERIDEQSTSIDPMEAAALATTGASGEHTGMRRLLAANLEQDTPVWAWWAPVGHELTIPTHDGGGQTCHPSVLFFPEGWNGWKYWMVHTPYPNFDEDHEDPNIAVSNDGDTWQVPEGLTNPLDDAPGRPGPHNSDAHLTMWGDTMVMTWRMVDRPNSGQNIIWARTSTDGVTWTPRQEVLKVPMGTQESTFVSQSLVKMPTGWRLYGIRSNYGPNRLGYYETSVETLPTTADWGQAQDCEIGQVPDDRDPWHSEVQRLASDDWVIVVSDGNRGTTGVDGDVFLGRSTDGVTWDMSPLPLIPRVGDNINSLYKTGFVVSGSGQDRVLDLFYSGYRTDERSWSTWRTTAIFRGDRGPSRPAMQHAGTGSPEGKVTAPVGAVYTDRQATSGAVRWIKTRGTGNTGWQVEYGDTGWRNITPSISTGWSGSLYIKRTGHEVTVSGASLRPPANGIVPLFDTPLGFRAARTVVGIGSEANSFRPVYALSYSPYRIEVRGIAAAMSWVSVDITFHTSDSWPATLPGIPD